MGQFDNFIPKVGLTTTGNRAFGESVVVKKPKPKVAAAGGNPPRPPKGPSNKKDPVKDPKKKPPGRGLGGLVKGKK